MVNFALLNELSLPFQTHNQAQTKFIEFFQILHLLKTKNIKKLRIEKDIKEFEIIKDIFFQQFFGQITDKDTRDRLRIFATNSLITIESPLIKDDEDGNEKLLEYEYFYDGESTQGALACCDIWNSLVISFNSSDVWDKPFIKIKKLSLDNKVEIEIPNISKESHFIRHNNFFDSLKKWYSSNITKENFYNQREKLFINKVLLSKEIENQVKNLDTNIFYQAITILQDIDYGKELKNYRISKESDSVRQNQKLKNMRMFTVGDKKEYFEKHIKSLSAGYRIYFFEKNEKIYIGYIGKHLPTQKY